MIGLMFNDELRRRSVELVCEIVVEGDRGLEDDMAGAGTFTTLAGTPAFDERTLELGEVRLPNSGKDWVDGVADSFVVSIGLAGRVDWAAMLSA